MEWVAKAADQGDAHAQVMLAKWTSGGQGAGRGVGRGRGGVVAAYCGWHATTLMHFGGLGQLLWSFWQLFWSFWQLLRTEGAARIFADSCSGVSGSGEAGAAVPIGANHRLLFTTWCPTTCWHYSACAQESWTSRPAMGWLCMYMRMGGSGGDSLRLAVVYRL